VRPELSPPATDWFDDLQEHRLLDQFGLARPLHRNAHFAEGNMLRRTEGDLKVGLGENIELVTSLATKARVGTGFRKNVSRWSLAKMMGASGLVSIQNLPRLARLIWLEAARDI
jgi:hypothetical protein